MLLFNRERKPTRRIITIDHQNHNTESRKNKHLNFKSSFASKMDFQHIGGLMSISWTQKVKLFYVRTFIKNKCKTSYFLEQIPSPYQIIIYDYCRILFLLHPYLFYKLLNHILDRILYNDFVNLST